MKREALLRHLRRSGCVVRKEGSHVGKARGPVMLRRSLRHVEVGNLLARWKSSTLRPQSWARCQTLS